jgi:8-oxo-dGTP diphosphatase
VKTKKGTNQADRSYPLLSVDAVIFSVINDQLSVLLVKRATIPEEKLTYPFQGRWALVGGVIDVGQDKSLEAAAMRKLREKTNVESPYLEQLQSFGDAHRDPRKWSATVAYFALIPSDGVALAEGRGVEQARWWPIEDAMKLKLAFDHNAILQAGVERLRAKVEYTSLPANLLPKEFTLTELQHIYEVILGRPLEQSAFRKRMLAADFLIEGRKIRQSSAGRPAALYRVKPGHEAVFFPRTFYV